MNLIHFLGNSWKMIASPLQAMTECWESLDDKPNRLMGFTLVAGLTGQLALAVVEGLKTSLSVPVGSLYLILGVISVFSGYLLINLIVFLMIHFFISLGNSGVSLSRTWAAYFYPDFIMTLGLPAGLLIVLSAPAYAGMVIVPVLILHLWSYILKVRFLAMVSGFSRSAVTGITILPVLIPVIYLIYSLAFGLLTIFKWAGAA